MIIHQSDLSSWSRCAAAFGYSRAGMPRQQLSATAYGSVVHHALQVLERERHTDGVTLAQAIKKAQDTFLHYWSPAHIEAICEPVDIWLPRQGYAELRKRGVETIEQYAHLVAGQDEQLLATEFSFQVPIDGTWDDELGEPHVLAGSVDRLSLRYIKRHLALETADYKTGKEQKYLRQNLQFTAYCYATTKREYWVGWRGEDGFGEEYGSYLYEKYKDCGRKATWINMRKVQRQDAGWRGQLDYTRLAIAAEQFAASVKADIFPLTIAGEVCTFCDFRRVCAGTGVPDDDYADPTKDVP